MMSNAVPEVRRMSGEAFPNNVGILAMDVYFPSQYVEQTDLEQFDGVGAGKYTVGLGQDRMAVCTDREDINSMCLTVTRNLLEKYAIPYTSIGRLEVGTETIIDKSKSVKSVLMQLFAASGNTDMEGIDTTNACYGGTNALFNAIHWIESSAWDGRFALVIAGDIAVYAAGPARPTGGAGVVAMLLGRDAPIVFERGLRATHMEHAWDFYKPDLTSEYPTVDGKLSLQCYFRALDRCYTRYLAKLEEREGLRGDVDTFDYLLFHSPFTKQVQKSFARLFLNDCVRQPEHPRFASLDPALRDASALQAPFDKSLETPLMTLSQTAFAKKVAPSLLLARELGNAYCGSLYSSLASLLFVRGDELVGKRIALFSYGSGLAASLFSVRVIAPLGAIPSVLNLRARLDARQSLTAAEYSQRMAARELNYTQRPFQPLSETRLLFPGTYYIESIDDQFRRHYAHTMLQ